MLKDRLDQGFVFTQSCGSIDQHLHGPFVNDKCLERGRKKTGVNAAYGFHFVDILGSQKDVSCCEKAEHWTKISVL